MRSDPFALATEDLEALAGDYGLSLGLELLGLGQAKTVIDILMTLSDLVAADDTQTALETEARQFLIEDAIAQLTLSL
jgi:hypothetical protein